MPLSDWLRDKRTDAIEIEATDEAVVGLGICIITVLVHEDTGGVGDIGTDEELVVTFQGNTVEIDPVIEIVDAGDRVDRNEAERSEQLRVARGEAGWINRHGEGDGHRIERPGDDTGVALRSDAERLAVDDDGTDVGGGHDVAREVGDFRTYSEAVISIEELDSKCDLEAVCRKALHAERGEIRIEGIGDRDIGRGEGGWIDRFRESDGEAIDGRGLRRGRCLSDDDWSGAVNDERGIEAVIDSFSAVAIAVEIET